MTLVILATEGVLPLIIPKLWYIFIWNTYQWVSVVYNNVMYLQYWSLVSTYTSVRVFLADSDFIL